MFVIHNCSLFAACSSLSRRVLGYPVWLSVGTLEFQAHTGTRQVGP
jgi:hypothetical protein